MKPPQTEDTTCRTSDCSASHTLSEQSHLDDSSSSIKSNKKRVHFGNLHVREYPIIVGDNPAVTLGVPMAIAWEHDGEVVCSVEEYEEMRPTPRSMIELKMPNSCRTEKLRNVGFSRKDIMEGTRLANIVRNRRKRTNETIKLSGAHELLERAVRATMNATVRRSNKQKERDMMSSFASDSKQPKRASMVTAPVGESAFLWQN